MIRHILKIIWNERRSNLWILLEYTLVFCVLWFCCDYCSSILRTYKSDPGIDIRDTYRIEMGYRTIKNADGIEPEYDRFALAMTLLERVKHHPDVAYVALGRASIPYNGSFSSTGWILNDEKGSISDSLFVEFRMRAVTPDFFRVFNIPLRSGRMFRWPDDGESKNTIVSTIGPGVCGEGEKRFPIDNVRTFSHSFAPKENEPILSLIGTTGQIHDTYWGQPMSTIYYPLPREQTSLYRNEIALRVKPGTDKDFPQRFRKEMSEQLKLGPYFLASVKPISDYKAKQAEEVNGELNGVYSVTIFLVINIMLGILGTFYFRIQSRRSEIGLRIALGSSKRKIRSLIFTETLLLLFLASIIATILCVVLRTTGLIENIGIPAIANRAAWGIGVEQDVINFAITFVFVAVISIVAVWYPARQAVKVQPAEALHEE
ncbi:ABC transporter permease [Alistipes indistinctus]|uniref:ABC transporter permease n=1 Tax=Alistipes indistinctus TaxID=626932 RepID=UPI003F0DCE34